ncbi:MAG: hypothetical protein WC302_02000 [Candidatus Paceibacterota bacterium]|jgi:hypothetical protein
MSNDNSILNLQSWKAVLISVLCVLALGLVLSWQYKRMEENSQEKLSSLEDVLTMGFVEDVVDDFMIFRISGNEKQAVLFLTEGAYQQFDQNGFSLVGDMESYKITKKEKLDEETFRFRVEIYGKDAPTVSPEIIIMKLIGDAYYVDSVETAG